MTTLYANNIVGTVQTGIGITDTTITLLPGHGNAFPNPGTDEYFYATLINEATGVLEIVKVTDRVGDALTVERGVDSTSPQVFPSGSKIEMRLVAEMLRELGSGTGFVRKIGDVMTGPLGFLANGVTWTWTADPVTGNYRLTTTDNNKQLDLFLASTGSATGSLNLGRVRQSMPVLNINTTTATIVAVGSQAARSAVVVCSAAGATTLTIRKNTGDATQDWRLGDYFTVVQRGGQVTVNVGAGATLLVPSGAVAKTRASNSTITLTCIDATSDTWLASSDLALA